MRRLGLIFHKDDEAGIALVTVTDTVTGINLVDEEEVDLYTPDYDATNGAFEEFIFWVNLLYNTSGRYTFTYSHSGRHNPAAVGAAFPISFNGFLLALPNQLETRITKTFSAANSVYGGNSIYPVTVQDKTISMEKIVSYSGDGTTELFDVTAGIYAAAFNSYSLDSGVTWNSNYIGDYSLTWGSNSLHNDNIILAGKFSVNFTYPPPVGVGNVQFKVTPFIDSIICTHNFRQAVDASGQLDLVSENRLLHYSLELIP